MEERIAVIKALRRLVERDEVPLASFRLLAFEVEELAAACTQLARRLVVRRHRDPSVPPLDTHPVALDRSQQSLAQARRALEEGFGAIGVRNRKP